MCALDRGHTGFVVGRHHHHHHQRLSNFFRRGPTVSTTQQLHYVASCYPQCRSPNDSIILPQVILGIDHHQRHPHQRLTYFDACSHSVSTERPRRRALLDTPPPGLQTPSACTPPFPRTGRLFLCSTPVGTPSTLPTRPRRERPELQSPAVLNVTRRATREI